MVIFSQKREDLNRNLCLGFMLPSLVKRVVEHSLQQVLNKENWGQSGLFSVFDHHNLSTNTVLKQCQHQQVLKMSIDEILTHFLTDIFWFFWFFTLSSPPTSEPTLLFSFFLLLKAFLLSLQKSEELAARCKWAKKGQLKHIINLGYI